MQFSSITGQHQAKVQLTQLLHENRVPHALMLIGPPGNGKFQLALAFAQYINCRNRSESDSCGVCNSCLKYKKLIHPDLHFSVPVVKKKSGEEPTTTDFIAQWREFILANPYPQSEKWIQFIASDDNNRQGVIYQSEAKEIISRLSRKSFEADYKVQIVWLPETMNVTCANKILKVLEEPPADSVFLLITEAEQNLLSTIRSRCQTIRIPGIATGDLAEALRNHPSLNANDPVKVAKIARGNFLQAEEFLLEDEVRKANYNSYTKLMRSGYGRKLNELIDWSDEMAMLKRMRQMNFLKYCGEFTRENFMSNLKQEEIVSMDQSEESFSSKFAPFINEKNALFLYREFDKAYKDIAGNGNAKVIFTDLAIKVSKYIRM